MNQSSNPIIAFISLFQQAEAILMGSFIFAAIITLLAYYSKGLRNQSMKRKGNPEPFKYHWNDLMGTPRWSFTNSWATTITTIGAVLGTFLTSVQAVDQRTFQSEGVLGLSLFFGLIVLIAPILYSAISVHTRVMDEGEETPEYQGFVWMFGVISCITLWAVFGQLITVTNTLNVLVGSDTFLQTFFIIAVLISIIGVAAYAILTIPWTIQDQLDKEEMRTASTYQTHLQTMKTAMIPQEALEKHVQTFVAGLQDALVASLSSLPQVQDQKVPEPESKPRVSAKGNWPLL